METILIVVQVVVAVSLIGIVLIQRSDSDGFGLGSGSGMNFMSSRSTATFFTRATAVLATIFIINSLALSILAARDGDASLADTIKEQEAQSQLPSVPVAGDVKKEAANNDKKDAKAKEEKPSDADAKKEVKKPEETKKAPSVPKAE